MPYTNIKTPQPSAMKRTICSFALTRLIICAAIICYGKAIYSQERKDNEHKPIIYSYDQQDFLAPLPFDEIFSVKIIEIPATVNAMAIKIYRLKEKTRKYSPGVLVAPGEIPNMELVCQSAEWERPTGSSTISAQIPVPCELDPNYKFVIGVEFNAKNPLTSAQKTALTTNIKSHRKIIDLVSITSREYLKDPNKGFSEVHIPQNEFNVLAAEVVQATNRRYLIESLPAVDQLAEFTNFMNDLKNVGAALTNLKESAAVMAHPQKPSVLKAIEAFKQALIEIAWGNILDTDADFSNLTVLKEAIFASFVGPLPGSLNSQKARLEDFLSEIITHRDQWLSIIADNTIASNTYKYSSVNATYRAEFVENAKLYVTLDVGAAYTFRPDRVYSYSGINIYLRPVNKNIPLRSYKKWKWFAVRTSFVLGLTMNSVEKANARKGLVGNQGVILGVGIRPVPFLKINAGGMSYYTFYENPLISPERYRFTMSPFVSLSVDLDAKSLFAGVGEAIFK